MKKTLAALLTVVLVASGCASSLYAIKSTPRYAAEALDDPVRRSHLVTQASRIMSVATIGIGCVAYLLPTIVGAAICPLVALAYDFVMFEYVLEPLSKDAVKRGEPSLVGPYWETGPRADEGEFFRGCEKPTHTCRPPSAP